MARGSEQCGGLSVLLESLNFGFGKPLRRWGLRGSLSKTRPLNPEP